MPASQWDYTLAEEAFACGHEPRVVDLADGSKILLTNWMTGDVGDVTILAELRLVQRLRRYKDDLGAWKYKMIEYDPEEYAAWMRACKEFRAVLHPPPSYHDDIDVPDFIGAELWEEASHE